MAPILAPILGVYFWEGLSPSKIGHIAPFLATIQRLSKTHAFLLEKRSEGCFVWVTPSLSLARTYLIIALTMWYVSWESNPARQNRCKVAKCYPRGGYLSLNTWNIWWCIRIRVTPSNGLVGTPDFFSGTTLGSILSSVVKLWFFRVLLHLPMIL
jgi:hypothetical protein